jgi:hypothetical protein
VFSVSEKAIDLLFCSAYVIPSHYLFMLNLQKLSPISTCSGCSRSSALCSIQPSIERTGKGLSSTSR